MPFRGFHVSHILRLLTFYPTLHLDAGSFSSMMGKLSQNGSAKKNATLYQRTIASNEDTEVYVTKNGDVVIEIKSDGMNFSWDYHFQDFYFIDID